MATVTKTGKLRTENKIFQVFSDLDIPSLIPSNSYSVNHRHLKYPLQVSAYKYSSVGSTTRHEDLALSASISPAQYPSTPNCTTNVIILKKKFLSSYTQSLIPDPMCLWDSLVPQSLWRYPCISLPTRRVFLSSLSLMFQTFNMDKWNTCQRNFPFVNLFRPPHFSSVAPVIPIFNLFCLSAPNLLLSLPCSPVTPSCLSGPILLSSFHLYFFLSVFWICCLPPLISIHLRVLSHSVDFSFIFLALNFGRHTHTSKISSNKYTYAHK